jgi:hypothetical protein
MEALKEATAQDGVTDGTRARRAADELQLRLAIRDQMAAIQALLSVAAVKAAQI